MFKLAGGFLLWVAFSLMGIKKYYELLHRKKSLEKLQGDTQSVKSILRCMCIPLDECFQKSGGVYKRASEIISGGKFPKEAIKCAMREFGEFSCEDIEMMDCFAQGLSAPDCNGQINNIDLLLDKINSAIKNAQTDIDKKGKLYFQGGALLGAVFVILLM